MQETKFSYFNRELSWIEFNARVLDEARQKNVPLLERLRFLTIVSSNFDEFFMIRVGSLIEQGKTNPEWKDLSGLTVREQLERISTRVHALVELQYQCLLDDILPGLAAEGIEYVSPALFSESQARYLESFFMSDVYPLLTPLRTAEGEPLPSLGNLRLHAAFLLRKAAADAAGAGAEENQAALTAYLKNTGALQSVATGGAGALVSRDLLAIVQIPASISRIVWLPGEGAARRFTLLDDVVRTFGERLFPGFTLMDSLLFKVARNADFAVDEEREDDFIAAMQEVLVNRQSAVPVRLVCTRGSHGIISFLKRGMGLESRDIYEVAGPIDLATLIELANIEGYPQLRNPSWKHFWPQHIPSDTPFWDELKRKDLFLHVPYHSYDPVLRFINDAAEDPLVLAIKMTLYRTSGDSPIIRALERAARSGKHVTVFVELKARFDEERNITWAHRLENVGVIVVYGIARLKVHAKILLVVRREIEGVRRYVHLSTGNYNDRTARFYVDMSLFTANEDIGNDATLFFNMISGYSAIMNTKSLVMAPLDLKLRLLSLIDREISRSTPENPGLIMAKMNSLADPEVIDALYRASNAGVRVKLNVRGVCMLIPGVPKMSEHITVVSIIDRFLEHTRIFRFGNDGADELFLSSADWMPRNLDRRIELMFPVLQDSIRLQIIGVLELYFQENCKAHVLERDGHWRRRSAGRGEVSLRVQEHLYEAEKRSKELQEKEPPREFVVRRS